MKDAWIVWAAFSLCLLVRSTQACSIDFQSEAAHVMVLVGQNTSVPCDATSCTTPPDDRSVESNSDLQVVWRDRYGKKIGQRPGRMFTVRYRYGAINRLILVEATSGDGGIYICSVMRNGTLLQQRHIRVIVEDNEPWSPVKTTPRPTGKRRGDILLPQETFGVLNFRPVRSVHSLKDSLVPRKKTRRFGKDLVDMRDKGLFANNEISNSGDEFSPLDIPLSSYEDPIVEKSRLSGNRDSAEFYSLTHLKRYKRDVEDNSTPQPEEDMTTEATYIVNDDSETKPDLRTLVFVTGDFTSEAAETTEATTQTDEPSTTTPTSTTTMIQETTIPPTTPSTTTSTPTTPPTTTSTSTTTPSTTQAMTDSTSSAQPRKTTRASGGATGGITGLPLPQEEESSFWGRGGLILFLIALTMAIVFLWLLLMCLLFPEVFRRFVREPKANTETAAVFRKRGGFEDEAPMTLLPVSSQGDGKEESGEDGGETVVHAEENDNKSFDDDNHAGVSTFLLRQNSEPQGTADTIVKDGGDNSTQKKSEDVNGNAAGVTVADVVIDLVDDKSVEFPPPPPVQLEATPAMTTVQFVSNEGSLDV